MDLKWPLVPLLPPPSLPFYRWDLSAFPVSKSKNKIRVLVRIGLSAEVLIRANGLLPNTCCYSKRELSHPYRKRSSALKDKSALRAREAIKTAPKRTFLTDEETKRCHEWAREGIEQTHFTGNDLQKLQKDIDEEGVNKMVWKVISDLHERSNDLGLTKEVLSKGTKDAKQMELETEVLPIITTSPTPGHEEMDSLLESEADHLSFLEQPIEFHLKEDYNADALA
ncbi:hypothetical protein OPV22_022868 [Ensete ventricosum]|uniref:Uncharacterized protein n=1 Tax=Ensete ventricosum TaxID=4639 RepID=A0AAV8QKN8_ENSVE|nr:hypothetical protein OPV22_022868 [Ensete ventricosum]